MPSSVMPVGTSHANGSAGVSVAHESCGVLSRVVCVSFSSMAIISVMLPAGSLLPSLPISDIRNSICPPGFIFLYPATTTKVYGIWSHLLFCHNWHQRDPFVQYRPACYRRTLVDAGAETQAPVSPPLPGRS